MKLVLTKEQAEDLKNNCGFTDSDLSEYIVTSSILKIGEEMNKKLIVGESYMSTGHGQVTYLGIDVYMGQMSHMFHSDKYGPQYWLPEALCLRLEDWQKVENVNACK